MEVPDEGLVDMKEFTDVDIVVGPINSESKKANHLSMHNSSEDGPLDSATGTAASGKHATTVLSQEVGLAS